VATEKCSSPARRRGSLARLAEDLAAVTPDDLRADASACLAGSPVLSLVGDEASVRPVVDAAWPVGGR